MVLQRTLSIAKAPPESTDEEELEKFKVSYANKQSVSAMQTPNVCNSLCLLACRLVFHFVDGVTDDLLFLSLLHY